MKTLKTTFLTLLLVLITSSVLSNSESKIKWLIINEQWDHAFTDTLELGESIVIEEINYNKVLYKEHVADDNVVGYYRTENGKSWFWGYKDTTEYLIQDLNLEVGDSFLIKSVHANKYAKVISIETIGERKTITLDYKYGGGLISENLKFIEGVGPNASLLYQVDETTATSIHMKFGYLVCQMFNNEEMKYARDTVNYSCTISDTGAGNISVEQSLCYPNPVQDILYVSNKIAEINIFTVDAKLVLKTKSFPIDMSAFENGIYIIEMIHFNGEMGKYKIIKNAW